MKVIITGGDGFIGKALAATLISRGVEVIIVDRKRGIEAKEFFADADNLQDVDCVYHLAAQTSVFNTDHRKIIDDNIETFISVCDACRQSAVKLVYASSSTAHGPNTTSLYGISKHFNEEYARCYCPSAVGVRLHNVYGPNPRQGTLLWHLLRDKRVRLVNGGRNIRHFTYLADAVEGLIRAGSYKKPLVNVANSETTSILNFALAAKAYNGVEIEPVSETRVFDKISQKLDDGVFTLPLRYTTVADGLRKVFINSEHE